MNEILISKTKNGTKKYPLHQHPTWEVMYYLTGVGYLATKNENITFGPGTVIIVPPKTIHGSVSQDGFINISVGCNFNHLFLSKEPIVQQDNPSKNGELLAKLIYENRNADAKYVASLCNAFAHYLLQNFNGNKRINQTVQSIIKQVDENFLDPDFNITLVLAQSGYAEDYIRSEFKKITNLSPVDYLTKTRIAHAQKLFEIYGQSISVSEVAESCGFIDLIYFSKRFKQITGVSPRQYIKQTYVK